MIRTSPKAPMTPLTATLIQWSGPLTLDNTVIVGSAR